MRLKFYKSDLMDLSLNIGCMKSFMSLVASGLAKVFLVESLDVGILV